MFKRQDPYSYTEFLTLYKTSGTTPQAIGLLAIEYRVVLFNDVFVQNQSSVTQPANQQFYLHCTTRLFMANTGNSSLNPQTGSSLATEYFANYPALIQVYVKILKDQDDILKDQDAGVTLNLIDYSPQTVNTAVQQSASSGNSTGTTASTSNTSTTGNSYTQSSTYGTSVTAGDSFSGVTQSSEYTSAHTSESSKSTTMDRGVSSGTDSSSSASMSIKDWGSYASVNSVYVYPTWVFGQEFPWNAIECRFAGSETYPGVTIKNGVDGEKVISPPNDDQIEMIISNAMKSSLCDQNFLYPPSELSMFGLNFVMKASWRVYVPDKASTTLRMSHNIEYYSASHIAKEIGSVFEPQVYMDKQPWQLKVDTTDSDTTFTVSLDLNIIALDPLGVNTDTSIVGFLPCKFIPAAAITPPATTAPLPVNFKTISATNDVLIENSSVYGSLTTSGFSVSQACLTAAWSETQNIPYTLTVYFKVIDTITEYDLHIKHWTQQSTGIQLTIVINGDTSNTITKYVTSTEGEGGDNNVLTLALRDLDFASIDYHDYLQLGLNSIAITMCPIGDSWSANCVYQIRAISIVKS